MSVPIGYKEKVWIALSDWVFPGHNFKLKKYHLKKKDISVSSLVICRGDRGWQRAGPHGSNLAPRVPL